MTTSEQTRGRQPPVYARPSAKVRDDAVRPPLPGVVVDTIFFVLATLSAGWLAFRLLQDAWRYSWWHLFLLVPFWIMVAYLVLPRLNTMFTTIYVPNYFIARTRTSDGLLGDPVNLALDGTALQVHQAMTAAGWTLADDVTLRSSWGIIVSSVFRRSYPAAPVSPLALFGRTQCLAYEMEVEGNAAQRHHVRFWRCPDGWLLPGGHRVQWLGAGTYDRAVGLSLFTLQVTHKIDADIDVERNFIVDSVTYYSPEVTVDMLDDFSTGYHGRNGGGDAIRTDGDLPILDLTRIPVASATVADLPASVVRAARGYDDPNTEGGVVSPDPDLPVDDQAPDPEHLPRPLPILVAVVLVGVSVVLSVAQTVAEVSQPGSLGLGDLTRDQIQEVLVVIAGLSGVVYSAMAVLAVLTYFGYGRPRVWLMAATFASIVLGETGRTASVADARWDVGANFGLAVTVLLLLALTARAARVWSRRTALARRERRRAARGQRGLPSRASTDSDPVGLGAPAVVARPAVASPTVDPSEHARPAT